MLLFQQVVIQKETEQLVTSNLTYTGVFCSSVSDDAEWQQKLERAQNAIFCRELFAQLAKEAIFLQAPIPHLVVGNQITASLFPDIQVCKKNNSFFLDVKTFKFRI